MTGTEHIARRIRETAESVRAPDRLHASVAEQLALREPPRRRRLAAGLGVLAGAVAAIAVAVVLVLGDGGPSIDDAVALALRPPATGAPAVDPYDRGHLEAEVGGVAFPNYRTFAAVGSREDEIDGRRAVTVAYRASGRPVTYTIVDGAPLRIPAGTEWHDYGGYRMAVIRSGEERVLAWEQGGRTCIVAGSRDDVAALLRDARA
jgi:hypothetical protein